MQIVSTGAKCQILFSGKNEKHIINLLPAKLAQRVVKVIWYFLGKIILTLGERQILTDNDYQDRINFNL